MINILLLGKRGQLGWELARCLSTVGRLTSLDYPEIDLTQPDNFLPAVRAAAPQVIINATAYTAVDLAESQPDLANAINGRAPGLLAEAARSLGAALIHYSTDYVFPGINQPAHGILARAYLENDPPNPLSVYGKSKLAGEIAIQQVGGAYLILRTAWVYSLRRDSFVTKVLQWSRQQTELRLVIDQVSNPTWARLLAEVTAQLLGRAGEQPDGWLAEYRGLYHLAGEGYASRFDWAQQILALDPHKEEQVTRELLPALTSDFPTPAQRPLFSALDCTRFSQTFNLRLPDWQEGLRLAMDA